VAGLSDTGTLPACDSSPGFGVAEQYHPLSDYSVYLAPAPVTASGVARKKPPSLPFPATPLNAPAGGSPPFDPLPARIVVRPTLTPRPLGTLTAGVVVSPTYWRGATIPCTTIGGGGAFNPGALYDAGGSPIPFAAVPVAVTPALPDVTCDLTVETCGSFPIFSYVGFLEFSLTATVDLPEVWAYYVPPLGGPPVPYLYHPARTLTRTVAGVMRVKFKDIGGAEAGIWRSDCQAYVLSGVTVTCPGDGCQRQRVYGPGQGGVQDCNSNGYPGTGTGPLADMGFTPSYTTPYGDTSARVGLALEAVCTYVSP
jgi:hypothetical protein